jgi:hypothetical protein
LTAFMTRSSSKSILETRTDCSWPEGTSVL